MAIKFDPILGKIRQSDESSGSASILQYDEDPNSPTAEDAWVLRNASETDGVAGVPRGLMLSLTYAGQQGQDSYQLSYKTKEGDIKRISLT